MTQAQELAELQALLDLAQAVGYSQREWQEADHCSAEVLRHPHFEEKAVVAKAEYEELREELLQRLAAWISDRKPAE